MPTYPRTTTSAVLALLGGSVSGAVIAYSLIASAINGQQLNPASVYATSTVGAPTVNATTTNSTYIVASTVTSTSFLSSVTSTFGNNAGTNAKLFGNATTGTQDWSTKRTCQAWKNVAGVVGYIYLDETGTLATSSANCF